MGSKVFVGNLNYSTTESELRDVLSEAGDIVEVFLPSDRATGRPRGFAFVTFSKDDEAAAAIEKFDGHELGGRPLRINEAQERAPRPPRDFGDGGGFGGGGFGGGGGGYGGGGGGKNKGSRRGLRGKKRSL